MAGTDHRAFIYMLIKRICLRLCKYAGLFRLARALTRRRLRILCYHGFAVGEEARARPGLFMSAATFSRRLHTITRMGMNVIPLQTALEAMNEGHLPDMSLVITIDDGFYSTCKVAIPLLEKHGFPATVYVTSYYCINQHPVFRLAVQHMFVLTERCFLNTSGLTEDPQHERAIGSAKERHACAWEIIRYGEQCDSEKQRSQILQDLARRLEIDLQELIRTRGLHIMSRDEVRKIADAGYDVQLHTHRHRLPLDGEQILREIEDNRAVLARLVRRPLVHLCYPSGVWSKGQFPWLEKAGIASATTCDVGLNDCRTPTLALRRFLDTEFVSAIEFEAELSGFMDLLRQFLQPVLRRKK